MKTINVFKKWPMFRVEKWPMFKVDKFWPTATIDLFARMEGVSLS